MGFFAAFLIGQQLPLRWYEEYPWYQAAEAMEHGAYSAVRAFARAYQERLPGMAPQLPPSDLPDWWMHYGQYDLLREGSEKTLEAYADAHYPSYKSDLARYHAVKYAFLRGRYAEVLRLEEDLHLSALPKTLQEEAQFLVGYAAFSQGNRTLATEKLRPLSTKVGSYHDPANFYLGIMAYEQGDFQQAAHFFEAVQTKAPYRLAAPLWLAYSWGRLGAYARLAEASDRWLSMEPAPLHKDTLWPYVAIILAQGGFCEKAAAIETAFSQPLPRLWVGICHAQKEDWEKAFSTWEPLADREDTLGGWAAYGISYAYWQIQRLEEALLWAKTAVSRPGPPKEEVLWLLAHTAWRLQDAQTGIEAVSAYLRLSLPLEKSKEGRLMLSHFQILAGSYEEALSTLGGEKDSRFIEARQRASILQGLAAWQKANYAAAVQSFERAASANGPHTPTALLWLAEATFRQEDFTRAEKAYRDFLRHPAADRHPYKDLAALYLSWTLLRQNKPDEALRIAEALRNCHPLKQSLGKTATFLTGSAHFLQKRYESALTRFREVLSIDPQEIQARYYAALSLIRLERYKEAEALLEQGPEDLPGADKLLSLRAELCAEWLHQPACTRTAAEKILRNFPTSPLIPVAKARLGLALLEEGRSETALPYLREVLDKHADDPEAARLALEGLRTTLSADAYDRTYAEFIRRLPKEGPTRLSFERERLENLAADKRWPQLLTEARRLLSEIPTLTEARWWEAYALEMTGDTLGALTRYQTLQTDPALSVRALSRLVPLLQGQGRLSEAWAWQDSLLTRITPAGFTYHQALFTWSDIALKLHRTDTVLHVLKNLLTDTLLPTLTRQQALLHLAGAYEEAQLLDSALKTLNQVPRLDKNRWAAEALYHTARLAYERKDPLHAREAIYRLRDEYTGYPIPRAASYLILARIFLDENKYSSAKKLLENLTETAPTPEIKAQAKSLLDSLPPPPSPSPPQTPKRKGKK